jgi:hypothetical protein
VEAACRKRGRRHAEVPLSFCEHDSHGGSVFTLLRLGLGNGGVHGRRWVEIGIGQRWSPWTAVGCNRRLWRPGSYTGAGRWDQAMMAVAVSTCTGVVVVYGHQQMGSGDAESTNAGGMWLEVAEADGSCQGMRGDVGADTGVERMLQGAATQAGRREARGQQRQTATDGGGDGTGCDVGGKEKGVGGGGADRRRRRRACEVRWIGREKRRFGEKRS